MQTYQDDFKLDAPDPIPDVKDPEDLYKTWKASPTPKTTQALLDSLNDDIEASVRQYTGKSDQISVGYARQLAVQALPRYNPKQAKLKTFINRQIQPITRWNSSRQVAVHIPTRMRAEAASIARAEEELTEENGTPPSIDEIADRVGLPIRRIAKVRKAAPALLSGSQVVGESDDGDSLFADDLPVERDTSALWASFIRHDLDRSDRIILDHTLGINGADVLPNEQIAKMLRLSPAAVSQRRNRIQSLLDKQDRLSPFR
jgi:DNA-directed RNA polymerase specialized sigma subunit